MSPSAIRSLGDQINEICKLSGKFKRDIAEKMGVSNSYLSQILQRGGTPAQIESICKALAALNVRVSGKPVEPDYFDVYSALIILDEAQKRDPAANAALRWYAEYRRASGHPGRQRSALAALLEQLPG